MEMTEKAELPRRVHDLLMALALDCRVTVDGANSAAIPYATKHGFIEADGGLLSITPEGRRRLTASIRDADAFARRWMAEHPAESLFQGT